MAAALGATWLASQGTFQQMHLPTIKSAAVVLVASSSLALGSAIACSFIDSTTACVFYVALIVLSALGLILACIAAAALSRQCRRIVHALDTAVQQEAPWAASVVVLNTAAARRDLPSNNLMTASSCSLPTRTTVEIAMPLPDLLASTTTTATPENLQVKRKIPSPPTPKPTTTSANKRWHCLLLTVLPTICALATNFALSTLLLVWLLLPPTTTTTTINDASFNSTTTTTSSSFSGAATKNINSVENSSVTPASGVVFNNSSPMDGFFLLKRARYDYNWTLTLAFALASASGVAQGF